MTPLAPEVIAALTAAAKLVSLTPAALLALVSVETNGVPFASDGTPTILCEPAIFYAKLSPALRPQALKAGLAAKAWSRSGYAKQGTEIGRRAMCSAMIDLDAEAAYQSLSMGLGQIMGFNAQHAGYESAHAMFVGFTNNLDAQAKAIVDVLPALGVLDPLKRKDWRTVALRYNGPGERHNNYDARLARAYAHWEFALASGQTAAPAPGTLGLWSKGEPVRSIQASLTRAGLPVKIDGVFGPKTAGAVAMFQLRVGLPATNGVVDQATADAILHRESDPLPQGDREVATESDVAKGSRIVRRAVALRNYALGSVGLGTGAVAKATKDTADAAADTASDPMGTFDALHGHVTGALDKLDTAKATASRLKDYVPQGTWQAAQAYIAAHPTPFVAGGGAMVAGGVVAFVSHQISGARVDDYKNGVPA